MIGRVRGQLIDRVDHPHHCLATIMVAGIGIEVHAPSNDLARFAIGDEVDLYTDFVVREDAMSLYGFSSSSRRSLFRMLQTVSGVGPRVALATLATTDMDELAAAIIDSDLAFLERIPGIGKKVASRIALELREKMALPAKSADRGAKSDVVLALTNLGYSEREASSAVDEIDSTVSLEEMLKAALGSLNRNRR